MPLLPRITLVLCSLHLSPLAALCRSMDMHITPPPLPLFFLSFCSLLIHPLLLLFSASHDVAAAGRPPSARALSSPPFPLSPPLARGGGEVDVRRCIWRLAVPLLVHHRLLPLHDSSTRVGRSQSNGEEGGGAEESGGSGRREEGESTVGVARAAAAAACRRDG